MKTKRNPRQLRRMNWMKQLRKRERSASYVPTMMEPLEPRVLLSVNLPVMPGVTNNFTGVIAALSENYNRTSSTSPEYLAPSEIGGGLISVPTQMPGSFPSVRIVNGKIVGINLPQPGDLTNANDIRSGTPNDLISGAFQGLPIWGARSGAVGELTRNQTMSQQIAEDTTSLYAWGFTPSAVFGTDDGLAPGSTAGDGFGDYTNFIFGGNPGDLAFMTVTYFGALNDPSGLAGLFTPYLNLYEGGAAFDISTNGGALLNENDFDHNNGPAGSAGTSTLGGAVDGDLLLSVEVLGTSTANLTFTLVDVGRPGNAGLPDGIITPGIDQVKVSINFNAGLAVATGGKLVDEGLVELGSRVTFGFNIQQMLFISNAGGTDPNPNQFDYALLTGVTSASGDMSFFIDEPIILSSLGDYVWFDENKDGIQDADEQGIEGVTVYLIDGTDGVTILDSTTTDSTGYYIFDNLIPGSYAVQFVEPDGYDGFTQQNQGADDAVDSDADIVTGMSQIVTLAPGEHNPTLDAGVIRNVIILSSLGDYVWFDQNRDGIQDANEQGIEGVTVYLIDGTDGVTILDSTTTDNTGYYIFDNLIPGSYAVQFVQPNGYDGFTLRDQGADDAVDSDADIVTGMSQIITLAPGEHNPTLDAGVIRHIPGIDLEKYTNGVDTGIHESPKIAPGGLVTWTYHVTNTGETNFTLADIVITDDNGTPGNLSDDFSTLTGHIVLDLSSDVGNDGILSPGEVWIYSASALAQDLLTVSNQSVTFNFDGNSSTSGTAGNIRTFAAGGVSVKASAFSRTDGGTWNTAFLGSYSGGLGVTDTSEGNGGNGTHRVDNVGRHNYVLLEFSELVVVDQAYLDWVLTDSDITVWIGTVNDVFNNHLTLSDAQLASLGFTEVNNTSSSSSRWADFNNGQVVGNVIVIAASTSDSKRDDQFKLRKLIAQKVERGCYENLAVLVAGALTDSDSSKYCNPEVQSRPGIDIEKYVKKLEQSKGGEGLTPGFWKTHSEYGPAPHKGWPETGYSPDDSFETIFGVNVAGTPSLLDALNAGGGGINALMRHATAALLNAANPYVDYKYSVSQVISMTKTAINSGSSSQIESTKNLFETQNELGADLSTPAGMGGSSGIGADADTAGSGPTVAIGDKVVFTYIVKNTGDVALSNVVVNDDNATPSDTSDDFNPEAVLSGSFNVGDLNKNNLLDVGEEWQYTAIITATTPGEHKNIAVVTGKSPDELVVTDNDPAHYKVNGVTVSKGSISGYVYKECDNDGKKESGEQGIKNVKITLTGTDKYGNSVNLVAYTDSNGYYKFDNLVEGTYKVTETQPSGYLDGKDSAGSAGGTVGNDVISNIKLGAGVHATNYNFAEIGESKLSGYVYEDKDNDGKKESGENGIKNVKITLTGKNDLGQNVNIVVYTNADGYYEFVGLRPGNYTITETQPSGYNDGKEKLGSLGGCVSNDKFYNICLGACECGTNYNFGEVPKKDVKCEPPKPVVVCKPTVKFTSILSSLFKKKWC